MKHVVLALLLACSGLATSAEYEVFQKDKAFSATDLVIKVGDSVKFENADPFFHNVFSLSDAQMFDLGSYGTGESRSVTFDTEGTIEVECAIHPEMRLRIQVKN